MTATITEIQYTTIDLSVQNVHQSWCWEEIRCYTMTDIHDDETLGVAHTKLLRANIRRNAYDDQSYARIEQWSDERGWMVVASHPIAKLPCAKVSYTHKELDDDKQDLFIQTTDFLFGIGERFIGIADTVSK